MKFALVQNVEHFAPDIAGRADHCDFVTHRSLSEEICALRFASGKGSGSASMRETPSTQRYHGVWAFDEVVLGRRIGPFLLLRPNPSPADEFRRRGLRHPG